MIIANGSVSAASGTARVNTSQVLGIDETFWHLSPSGRTFALKSGEVLINESMAAKLHAKTGDAVIVRAGYQTMSAIPNCEVYCLNFLGGPAPVWAVHADAQRK